MKRLQRVFNTKLEDAETLEDLIPFLKRIDLESIRSFVKETISCEDDGSKQLIYCHSLSLTDILDKDVNQHIISFIPPFERATVCKLFNQLSIADKKRSISDLVAANKYKDCQKAYSKSVKQLHLKKIYEQQTRCISFYQRNINILHKKNETICKHISSLQDELRMLLPPVSLLNPDDSDSDACALPPFPVPYVRDFNTTWVVSNDRYRLTSDEIEAGYKGPCLHPMLAVKKAKSGDRILIHPGWYPDCIWRFTMDNKFHSGRRWHPEKHDESEFKYTFDGEKSLSLIGLGSKVCNSENVNPEQHVCFVYVSKLTAFEEDANTERVMWLKPGCKLYLQNIAFEAEMQTDVQNTIDVDTGSSLWIKDCLIKTGRIGTRVGRQSSLFATNCSYIGSHMDASGALIDTKANEVLISNCLFVGFGSHSEESAGDSQEYKAVVSVEVPKFPLIKFDFLGSRLESQEKKSYREPPLVKGKILKNRFYNNTSHLIACIAIRKSIVKELRKRLAISGNRMSGYNGIDVTDALEKKQIDPNFLYEN